MNIPSVVYHHYKEGNLNPFMCIYIPTCHILGMYGIIAYGPKTMAETWIWCYFIYYMTGECELSWSASGVLFRPVTNI